MFVMINMSDNPRMIALLLFVQVVVPLLQSSAGSEEENSQAVNLLILGTLGVALFTMWRSARFFRALYDLRHQRIQLGGWLALVREARARALAQATADAAAAAAQAQATANTDATSTEHFDKIMRMIQVMPMEEFRTPTELASASISELTDRLKRRDVAFAQCVERHELVKLLTTFRGGPTNNDTCAICCDEYQSGDLMRLLRKCKHEFHLECLDKWAFSSVNVQRLPSCPLCNQGLD